MVSKNSMYFRTRIGLFLFKIAGKTIHKLFPICSQMVLCSKCHSPNMRLATTIKSSEKIINLHNKIYYEKTICKDCGKIS